MVGEPESLFSEEPLRLRIERHDYDRLLMLSDGVFAIAITLLALDLKLPDRWDGSLGQLIGATGRPLIGYLFGFGLVGVFWFMHRRAFAQLAVVDRTITALNLLFLGLIGLTPYIARMIAVAGPSRGIPFYFVTIGSVFGTMALIRFWARLRPQLLHAGVDRRDWTIDGGFLAVGAVALCGSGAWAMVHHDAVNQKSVIFIAAVLVIGKRIAGLSKRP